jgi:ABC-type dipeptide/oligopeptide/nickel transport system permease subunit
VGLIAVLIGSSIGVTLGVVAGYAGGWLDMAISRRAGRAARLPGLVFLIAVSAALGPSLRNSMIAIGVLAMPPTHAWRAARCCRRGSSSTSRRRGCWAPVRDAWCRATSCRTSSAR